MIKIWKNMKEFMMLFMMEYEVTFLGLFIVFLWIILLFNN